jgi:hypothetical protein
MKFSTTSETVAAWATVAAVVVALFGPLWLDWVRRAKSRPSLTLRQEADVGWVSHVGPSTGGEIRLVLINAEDRDRAEDVEVFATAIEYLGENEEQFLSTPFRQLSLTMSDGKTTSTVPAGFERIVSLAVLEAPTFASPGAPANCGVWEVDHRPPLRGPATHLLRITVTGSNFNAQSYTAQLAISIGDTDADGVPMTATFRWSEPFTVVRIVRKTQPPPQDE